MMHGSYNVMNVAVSNIGVLVKLSVDYRLDSKMSLNCSK